jgi:hypothetical protein
MTLVLSIVTVMLVVITTVTAVLTYRRGTKRRLLLYKVVAKKSKIARAGKRPQTCYVVSVALMNVGLHDILVDDFNGGQPLEIDLGTPILGTIGPLRGEKLNKIQVRVGRTGISIEPNLIPSRAFILRQVLTLEKPNEWLAHRSLADIPVLSASETSDATIRRFGWSTVPSLLTISAAMGARRGIERYEEDDAALHAVSIWFGGIYLLALLLAAILLAQCVRSYAKGSGAFRFKVWSALRRARRHT